MTYTKDPHAVLDYAVDWVRWLDGDQIVSSLWIVPDEITASGDTQDATKATVWLSGGAAGQSYVITNRITTAGGRIEDRSFTLRVLER